MNYVKIKYLGKQLDLSSIRKQKHGLWRISIAPRLFKIVFKSSVVRSFTPRCIRSFNKSELAYSFKC